MFDILVIKDGVAELLKLRLDQVARILVPLPLRNKSLSNS
jgi:hypothetical protein